MLSAMYLGYGTLIEREITGEQQAKDIKETILLLKNILNNMEI